VKTFAFVVLAGLLVTASASFAQSAPDQQTSAQMEQIRVAERMQLLQALTPAHRALLGNVVATLSTSVNPDVNGAVRQIDATLSPTEKQSILDTAKSAQAKERSLIESARAQRAPDGGMHGGVPRGPRTDAALVLLRRAMPDIGMPNDIRPNHG
jgi:hypothetical protein